MFEHTVLSKHERLVRGFDELYYVPHSRHTDINMEQLQAVPDLNILTASKEAGVCLIVSKDEKQVFLTGHPEYDTNTLLQEYERDLERNLSTVEAPKHYFAKGKERASESLESACHIIVYELAELLRLPGNSL